MTVDGLYECKGEHHMECMVDGWKLAFVIIEKTACLEGVACVDGLGVEIDVPASVMWNGGRYVVGTVYPNAFGGCVNLKRVTLPASVEMICDDAFVGCGVLEEIWCKSESVMMRREAIADSVGVYRGGDRRLWVMNELRADSRKRMNLKITGPMRGTERREGRDCMIEDIMKCNVKKEL